VASQQHGTSYELASLGKASWENLLAHPGTGARTVVVGLDDSSGLVSGQVYVYAGTTTSSAHPIEAAGLANGVLLGIQVAGMPIETITTMIADDTPFTKHAFGDVSSMTGAAIEGASQANRRHRVSASGRRRLGRLVPARRAGALQHRRCRAGGRLAVAGAA
jgi:hypothetical protein